MNTRPAIMETPLSNRRWLPASLNAVAFCCFLRAVSASVGLAGEAPQGASAATSQTDAPVVSLRVVPGRATLWGARASQRFVVLGTFADGLERDLTSRSHLSISDPRLASLDPSGRVAALADGDLDLKAEVGSQAATARVRIEGSREARPFSFARDIGRILTQRGCNATSCHGSVKGQKGFKLSLERLVSARRLHLDRRGGHLPGPHG